MALVIGLTGGIATGKSTVSRMLKDRDVPVVDADVIAREVVQPGEPAYRKIVDLFGKEILLESGEIDRKKLGKVIFAEEEKRKQLNQIVHPAVREQMLATRDQLIAAGKDLVVLDIPLLFESKLVHFVEKVVVVYVKEEIQLKRLMDRDNSTSEEAMSRINAQLSIEEKARLADKVIDNSGTREETERQLNDLLEQWAPSC